MCNTLLFNLFTPHIDSIKYYYISFTDQETKTQKYKVISPIYKSEGAGV